MLEIIGTMVHLKMVYKPIMNRIILEFTLRATDPDGLYKDQAFSLNVLDDVSIIH